MSSADEENWEDENSNAGGAAMNSEQRILQNSDDDDDDNGQIVRQQSAMTTLNHQNLGLEDSSHKEDQANGCGDDMTTQDIVHEEEVDTKCFRLFGFT